jgi:hypothetical protein
VLAAATAAAGLVIAAAGHVSCWYTGVEGMLIMRSALLHSQQNTLSHFCFRSLANNPKQRCALHMVNTSLNPLHQQHQWQMI